MLLYEFFYPTLLEYDDSLNAYINRIKNIYARVERGSTQGEKDAAKNLLKTMLRKVAELYGDEESKKAYIKAKTMYNKNTGTSSKSKYRRKESPRKEPPKSNTKPKNPHKSGDSMFGDSYEYENWTFINILRFTDMNAGERGSDKIWGIALDNKGFISFWGRYKKTVQTKRVDQHHAANLVMKKMQKGYKPVKIDPTEYHYLFVQSKNWK